MKKTISLYSKRTALILFETLAVIAGLLLLTGGAIAWRLTSGSIDIGFARSYIENALRDPVSNTNIVLGDVVLEWPRIKGPLMLGLDHVSLVRGEQTVLSVAQVRLGLAVPPLLAGRMAPVIISLESPAIRLIRTAQNDIRLSVNNEDAENDISEDPQKNTAFMDVLETLSQPADKIHRDSPLSHLQNFEIRDARMVMEDHVMGVTWYLPKLELVFSREDAGLAVSAALPLPGGYDQAAHIQADAVYSRENQDFRFNLHLQDFDPHVISRKVGALDILNEQDVVFNGNISGRLDRKLVLQEAALSLESRMGRLTLEGLYNEPLPFDELLVDASYKKAENTAHIKNISLTVRGVTFEAASTIKINEDQSLSAPITIDIAELPQERIAPLWPDILKGDGAEIWLTQRLSKGTVKDIKATLDLQAKQDGNGKWGAIVLNPAATFAIEGMTIDYRHPLTPVLNASGNGKVADNKLEIDVTGGTIGDIAIKKGHVLIDNLEDAVRGMAYIKTELDGPMASVLRYIAAEPIGMDEKTLGLEVAKVKGRAALDINVSFPTIRDLKADEVVVKAEGTLNDILLPKVVRDMDLTGGPLSLYVADGAAELKGQALIGGAPVTMNWKQYVHAEGKPFSSQVRAVLSADPALRQRFGIGLEDWVEGTVPLQVTYTEQASGNNTADIIADLTPAKFMVKAVEYEKPPGTTSEAKLQLAISQGRMEEIRSLSVQTPELKISGGRLIFGIVGGENGIKRGQIQKAVLNETNIALEFEIDNNGLLKLAVNGAFFDARSFLDKGKEERPEGKRQPVIASLSIDRMRTTAQHVVNNAKIYVHTDDLGRVNQLEMDALAGKGKIYLRLKPQASGKLKLDMDTDDAGALLQTFNIYNNVRGGKLTVSGESLSPEARFTLQGHAEITDFNVVNAPVLAQLVSALSLTGLPQLLSNEGLYFARLKSDFDWKIRPGGDLYVVHEGRTSGSSIGLTFEGTIDKAKKQTDIAGTIVPVSMLNELVTSIPLIGDVLSGGTGAIFAATYTIKGNSEKPEISVNPLSVLAPGFLRRMFFEGEGG